MSYETVIAQIKEMPAELLDEVSVFLSFLKYRTQNEKKSIDSEYNLISAGIASDVTIAARATIWEQIKDDTW